MLILTFDIEDWFHTHQNRNLYSGRIWDKLPSTIEKNTHKILEILDETNHKATFFLLGWVVERYPDLVKMISAHGHELAAHSNWHHNPNLISPVDFEKDLQLCIRRIEDVSANKVKIYRAPGFSLRLKDDWAFGILAKNGIEIDSSIKLNHNKFKQSPFVIKSTEGDIFEFPLFSSTLNISWWGGGYFRALPHMFIDKVFKPELYQLLYLHPRDFDATNPYTNLFSFTRNLMNSYNTASCENKLKYLLKKHKTYSMGQYYNSFLKNVESDK